MDKIILTNNSNSNSNYKINTNTSVILNDLSSKDLKLDMDGFSDEIFPNEKEEIIDIFGSLDNQDNNVETLEKIEKSLDNDIDLELIDYLFNTSFENELNGVQGGYLIKIILSLMHSLYSPGKSIAFMKYICFRKNGEILNNMIKKIKNFYFQEIIYNILIYNDEENNFSAYGGLEKKKSNIIIQLINHLKMGVEGIKEIFCEYIINFKNEDLLIKECAFDIFCSEFVFNNENIFDRFCVIYSHILKEYKFENCMQSNSRSFIFRTASAKGVLNNSLITLNVGDKDDIISKINKVIKNIQLNILTSTSVKINFLTFIFDFMSLTRGNELLNNLKTINFFLFVKNTFFSSKNDIIQSIIINTINLFLQDNNHTNQNHKWLAELLINNGFITKAVNIKNNSYSKYGLCSESLYIHVGTIFDILIKNLSDFLTKNNILKKVENCYNKNFKNYFERMNKPIFEVNNSLNISQYLNKNLENENDLKVDEIPDMQGVDCINSNSPNSKGVFDLTETSFIRKNSNSVHIKEILSISQEDKFFSEEDEKGMLQSLEKTNSK